jgi:hypothetical protein
MHLVFLNQYYPPDAAPTGVMLAAVVEELAAQGHQVTVICAEGGYAEMRLKTSRRKTQEVGGELSVVGCQSSEEEFVAAVCDRRCECGGELSVVDCQLSEEEEEFVAAVCDRRCECGAGEISRSSGYDAHRAPLHAAQVPPLHSRIRILRIKATRFGRGTFVGKVVDYLSYYVGVAWKLMFLRPDRIVALTTPPYLSVLARVMSKLRGGDHAHWVMDLYPDVMVAHGMLREKGLSHRVLTGLARWGFGGRRRAALLTLGPDMADRIAALMGKDRPGRAEAAEKRDPAVAGRPAADEVGRMLKSDPTGDDVGRMRRSDPTWVPLWSGDAGEVERRTSNLEHRTLKNGGEEGDGDGLAIAKRRREMGWGDQELVVMYSGNMGLGHRFGEILEVIGRDGFTHPSHLSPTARDEKKPANEREDYPNPNPPPHIQHSTFNIQNSPPPIPHSTFKIQNPKFKIPNPIRWVFFGGGKRRGEIEAFVREHPGAAVELHDYAPAETLGVHLRSADLHLVSLDPAWTGTMLPSKLQGIFAAERPVIFIGDTESGIGRWVRESGGGWVVAAGDVAGLAAAIDEASEPRERVLRGRAARAFAERFFGRETNVRRIAELMTDGAHPIFHP